jgi:hypothetical protein
LVINFIGSWWLAKETAPRGRHPVAANGNNAPAPLPRGLRGSKKIPQSGKLDDLLSRQDGTH